MTSFFNKYAGLFEEAANLDVRSSDFKFGAKIGSQNFQSKFDSSKFNP